MLKRRLIPVLFLQNGYLVRSEGFCEYQILGNPVEQVERYNAWDADELIYIDISQEGHHDRIRDDTRIDNPQTLLEIIEMVASRCFMPLVFGGNIRTLDDIAARLNHGADKVTLNTQALQNPEFISEASRQFGSQAIVISMDVKIREDGVREVWQGGRVSSGREPTQWADEIADRGAGEIFLNSIDRDGRAMGYDLEFIEEVVQAVSIPVIACGGAGNHKHFMQGLDAGASAVAAGNLFHFKEMSYVLAKKKLRSEGYNVR